MFGAKMPKTSSKYLIERTDFRPERMLHGGFEKLPPDAWKPFGNGVRGCIGRPFAWQESLLVVAMVSRSFIRAHASCFSISNFDLTT